MRHRILYPQDPSYVMATNSKKIMKIFQYLKVVNFFMLPRISNCVPIRIFVSKTDRVRGFEQIHILSKSY